MEWAAITDLMLQLYLYNKNLCFIYYMPLKLFPV